MQILTRKLRLQMTENSPEPRGIRKAKKATRKYSSESNSNISPLLLFHNSIAFCILKRSPSPLKRICQVTIKLIIINIPGISAANRKITRWQNGFRLHYFKGWSTGKRQRKQSWNLKIISEYKKKIITWKLSTTISGVFPTTVALLQEV